MSKMASALASTSASSSASKAESSQTPTLKMTDEMQMRAIGCLLGQATGDALGTRYEFKSSASVHKCMKADIVYGHLPILGDGPFSVAPGQVTDDTELALGLARSLVKCGGFSPQDIAQTYTRWYHSPPFDCGGTTMKAFNHSEPKKSGGYNYQVIRASAKKSNQDSLSNGCMMRISPLAIAGLRWNPAILRKVAQYDCQLTNPSEISQDAVAVYVTALQTAMLTGDKYLVYAEAIRVAKTKTVIDLLTSAIKCAEPIQIGKKKELTQGPNMGYFGIALQNAFYELMNGTSYEDSLVRIIRRGGDTDTNGCIAGSLLGAYYGGDQIPPDWISTVINAKTQNRVEEYPEVATADLIELALQLVGEEQQGVSEPVFG
jgi:ADP-ribosyl-[dinitrogen reductase] hydrolase